MVTVKFERIRLDPHSQYGKQLKATKLDLSVLFALTALLLITLLGAFGMNGFEIFYRVAGLAESPAPVTDFESPKFQTTPNMIKMGAAFSSTSYQFKAIDPDTESADLTFTTNSADLPKGMRLSSDGELSGIPTEAGHFNLMVSVTDTNQHQDHHTVLLQIEPPCAGWMTHNQTCPNIAQNTLASVFGVLPLTQKIAVALLDAEAIGKIPDLGLRKNAAKIYLSYLNSEQTMEKVDQAILAFQQKHQETFLAQFKELNAITPASGTAPSVKTQTLYPLLKHDISYTPMP